MFKEGMLDIGNTVLKAAVSGVNLEIAKLATVTSRDITSAAIMVAFLNRSRRPDQYRSDAWTIAR